MHACMQKFGEVKSCKERVKILIGGKPVIFLMSKSIHNEILAKRSVQTTLLGTVAREAEGCIYTI